MSFACVDQNPSIINFFNFFWVTRNNFFIFISYTSYYFRNKINCHFQNFVYLFMLFNYSRFNAYKCNFCWMLFLVSFRQSIIELIKNGEPGVSNFAIDQAIKDMNLMKSQASQNGVDCPIITAALDTARSANDAGWDKKDISLLAAWRSKVCDWHELMFTSVFDVGDKCGF